MSDRPTDDGKPESWQGNSPNGSNAGAGVALASLSLCVQSGEEGAAVEPCCLDHGTLLAVALLKSVSSLLRAAPAVRL